MSVHTLLAMLLRYVLAITGTALATRGYIDADAANLLPSETVVGGLTTVGAIGWAVAKNWAARR